VKGPAAPRREPAFAPEHPRSRQVDARLAMAVVALLVLLGQRPDDVNPHIPGAANPLRIR